MFLRNVCLYLRAHMVTAQSSSENSNLKFPECVSSEGMCNGDPVWFLEWRAQFLKLFKFTCTDHVPSIWRTANLTGVSAPFKQQCICVAKEFTALCAGHKNRNTISPLISYESHIYDSSTNLLHLHSDAIVACSGLTGGGGIFMYCDVTLAWRFCSNATSLLCWTTMVIYCLSFAR
jgi:hypothetical protein